MFDRRRPSSLHVSGWAPLWAAAAVLALAAGPARAGDLTSGTQGGVSLSTDAQSDSGKPKLSGAVSLRAAPWSDLVARVDLDAHAGSAPDGLVWTGAAPDPQRPWNDLGLGLQVDWSGLQGADLGLSASDRIVSRPVTAASLGGESDAPTDIRQDASAGLSAKLKPAPGLMLTVGGRMRRYSDSLDLGVAAERAHLKTEQDEASLALAWTPLPLLKLEAGDRFTTGEAAWIEGASATQAYAALQPSFGATLTPAADETLSLGLARTVSPLDPGKFVTLARASASSIGGLQPDSEWRLAARWKVAQPAIGKLELGVEEAVLESSTELTRVGADVEAPGSVAGGRRVQVDLALDMPLKVLGLDVLSLQSRSAWRRSHIVDPITGEGRRRSGEIPYEASVSLVAQAPTPGLTLGLSTRDQGRQSFYGLAQLTSVETEPSLGAFVEYRPEPFVLRLQVDDIAGGDRRWTDAYYAPTGRDLGPPLRMDHRDEGGPGFMLSLKRAL